MQAPPVRIAAIGLAHPHIFSMVSALVNAGAELVSYVPEAHGLGRAFAEAHPAAAAVGESAEILEDPSIELVLGAGIANARARVGIEALRHGKDFLADKPGFTDADDLAEARRVHAETGRRFLVCFSERFESRATVHAGELVQKGAIGRVLHTVGLGPHRLDAPRRPRWFFERNAYGGILCDLASHQVDQFLFFTGATAARVTSARVANRAHPEHPGLQDMGELSLESADASGYVRVDWFTPEGLPSWGDGRLFLVGTEGTIEVRKQLDVAGREGGNHLFLVDRDGPRHINCGELPLPFGAALLHDVRERVETSVTQAHCFLASELALEAQTRAEAGA